MSSIGEFAAIPHEGDGTFDNVWKRAARRPVASIFVHAGAGYHSTVNEKVHLKACQDAARIAMAFLKAGATAPQAVEAAIRCLEDRDITNAGFGSNLNIEGIVECDATLVDHLGRSGACGAVQGVKNPISLAKKILDTSSQPLTLRRVPPNILVGQGAKDFAEEHGLVTVRNEFLVSRNAKDRWLRWSEDLKRAEARRKPPTRFNAEGWPLPRAPSPTVYDEAADPANNSHHVRDHTSAILTGTWNEGQPDSPGRSGSPPGGNGSRSVTVDPASPRSDPTRNPGDTLNPPKNPERPSLDLLSAAFQPRGSPAAPEESVECAGLKQESPCPAPKRKQPPLPSVNDGPVGCDDGEVDMVDDFDYYRTYGFDAWYDQGKPTASGRNPVNAAMDMVSDTVGAIAIDLQGNIAAGSSSGGIGMKHKGRTGPAALVGVGTAVVPEDPDDDLATSVAAVTSGTGEHMATCFASGKCAERLYQGTRRGPGGRDIPEEDEHNIMESFILDDFMNHPGIRDQPSAGAIGVMAVKKDRSGVHFYFAHNTDSFALASMSSTEREPLCVMSRLGKTGRVAQGGRKVRLA
ncbi:N-terminal nucleophile aminohydrolase [Parathielavia appendiculata]|uniref:N-terminal nucleophile aminohydrolase n=1 Tax=Parathielavia appendiculata TaxID=2587402 RepID=A0AAN6TUE7_9PEZI|nr:N-terminal nucleophile aminohydrolase [Parathielavia appendiculata]